MQNRLVDRLVGGRYVKRRVLGKEPIRSQREADFLNRHDGEILHAGVVGETEGCEIMLAKTRIK